MKLAQGKKLKYKSEKKVLIALSGGIDSAVSAYLLLKQGYTVEAAFMKNWSSTTGLLKNECPWLQDRQDALRVAAFLNIPLHTLDFEKQYQKNVMGYFFKEYKAGRTPNPDVMCNKEVKFKLLYSWAMKNGFDYLATGHYAKIVTSEKVTSQRNNIKNQDLLPFTCHLSLARSADEFKDQTYFIYNIKTEQLPHILFPIGGMKKTEVRKLAQKIKLPNADKKESMGLCFVGKVRLKEFLEQKLKPKKGKIVLLEEGKKVEGGEHSKTRDCTLNPKSYTLGFHQGLYNYTIGQRQGIKVGGGGPYYVVKKDLKTNTLYVTNNPDDEALETKVIEIHSVNWIGKQGDTAEGRGCNKTSSPLYPIPYTLLGRFRHQGDLVPLTITPIQKGHYRVTFKQPQKAIASGQSLVLYKGKECVGGGVIV
jgi:tRNA-specific 2-thiouridylase